MTTLPETTKVLTAVAPTLMAQGGCDCPHRKIAGCDHDDMDAIYVDNGDIDMWLRACADRIEGGA